jgi:predicted MFS family arabinose efflux permease
MGLTELAWAASSLVGIPVAGWLVHSYSWNTPFVVMGVLGLGGTTLLRRLLPSDKCSYTPQQPRVLTAYRALLQRPAARAMLLYAFLVSCASDIFFVTYALWMADSFAMGVVALGLATIAIGMAELSGELLAATLADRLGLRRTLLTTLLITACCYALLPLWGLTATGALVGIFLLCLAAEFNLVAAMSLCTEIRPTARATMMSWFQAVSGVGHVVGVVTGGLLWLAGGIAGVALVCATLYLLGFLVVRWGFSQWQCLPADVRDVCSADDLWPQRERRTTNQTSVHLPIWHHQVWN